MPRRVSNLAVGFVHTTEKLQFFVKLIIDQAEHLTLFKYWKRKNVLYAAVLDFCNCFVRRNS